MENEIISSRKAKMAEKHSAILQAALEQITMYGFHGTSIKMIAASAQVSAGSIYNHFENKEEVIKELYLHIGAEINALIKSTHNSNISFKEDFFNIWKAILHLYINDPNKPEFITQFTYSPYIISQADTQSDVLLEPILEIFTKAKAEGIIKNIPNSALVALSHSPITSLVKMANYGKLTISDTEIETYAQACWDAIKL
ncbi:TetR/AcrR family transcriptional regulator [Formosa sp. 3Alg 14/1]|uniref:TetR/AcrR family transcriptional regulator n=1 Tax=unclassified Formosa TaxID=2644710 RepID=UPI0039BE1981